MSHPAVHHLFSLKYWHCHYICNKHDGNIQQKTAQSKLSKAITILTYVQSVICLHLNRTLSVLTEVVCSFPQPLQGIKLLLPSAFFAITFPKPSYNQCFIFWTAPNITALTINVRCKQSFKMEISLVNMGTL
jgi:hypothetical protein